MDYSLKRQGLLNSSISSTKETELSELFCNYCSWLNPLILWSSLWTPYNKSNKCRSIYVNIIGITITILLYIYFIITTAINNKYHGQEYDETMMIYIMTQIVEYTYYILKFLSIYYFLIVFNYPWNNMTKMHSYDIKINKYAIKRLKSTHNRLKLLLFIYTCVSIYFNYYMEFGALSQWAQYNDPLSNHYALFFTMLFCIEIPMLLSQYVLTIIFLKYELYLHGLRKHIYESNHSKLDFETLIKEYGIAYKMFGSEYKIFQLIISLSFIGIFCMIWIFISSLIHYSNYIHITLKFNGVAILILATAFIEFIIAATYLTNEYDQIKMQLTKFDDYSLEIIPDLIDDIQGKDLVKLMKNINGYHCFISFVMKYPICAQLIGWKVSITNCFRFLCFFAVAKSISYVIYYI
eukprot:500048_1